MKHAFTLIELLIVVAILGLLATLALPRYSQYFDQARQAEVSLHLASLHTAQEMYHATHGTYSTQLGGDGGIGWIPEGYDPDPTKSRLHYTYGFNVPGGTEGVHFFTGKLKTPVHHLGRCYADVQGFCARAAGTMHQSKKVDCWSVDQQRTITHEKHCLMSHDSNQWSNKAQF